MEDNIRPCSMKVAASLMDSAILRRTRMTAKRRRQNDDAVSLSSTEMLPLLLITPMSYLLNVSEARAITPRTASAGGYQSSLAGRDPWGRAAPALPQSV